MKIYIFLILILSNYISFGQIVSTIKVEKIIERGEINSSELHLINNDFVLNHDVQYLWLFKDFGNAETKKYLFDNVLDIEFKEYESLFRRFPIFNFLYNQNIDFQKEASEYFLDNHLENLKNRTDYVIGHRLINKAFQSKVEYNLFLDNYLKGINFKSRRKLRKLRRVGRKSLWDHHSLE